jgi:hypothetical protein
MLNLTSSTFHLSFSRQLNERNSVGWGMWFAKIKKKFWEELIAYFP